MLKLAHNTVSALHHDVLHLNILLEGCNLGTAGISGQKVRGISTAWSSQFQKWLRPLLRRSESCASHRLFATRSHSFMQHPPVQMLFSAFVCKLLHTVPLSADRAG